jgi:predicted helicase
MADNAMGLAVCRLTKGGAWGHCMITADPSDDSYISDKSKERAYLYPLYAAPQRAEGPKNVAIEESSNRIVPLKNENLSSDFRAFLDFRYDHHYTPEEILGYVYAILHTPSYRSLYAEFLRIDFPRVPFAESSDDFETLSELGWALAQAHLLRELPRRGLATYHGKGNHTVEAVRYSPEGQSIAINKTQFFEPVPQAVWEFHIGGYQVLDKYLKSRKGRMLSLDDINHVSAIADSLAFTIDQMAKIDVAYLTAFPNRG